MKITSIETKNKQKVKIKKFTVLVGPNNVGKSRTLKDIREVMLNGPGINKVILEKIAFNLPNKITEITQDLVQVRDTNNPNVTHFKGMKSDLNGVDTWSIDKKQWKEIVEKYEKGTEKDKEMFIIGSLSKFKVAYLDGASRLTVTKETGSHDPDSAAAHNLLQALFLKEPIEKELKQVFKQTFNMEVSLEYGTSRLRLRVAEKFPKISKDPRKSWKEMRKFSRLDDQGDGYKSFAGVVLSSLISKMRIILLDEPEAFLHPAQAKTLGKWMGEYSKKSDNQLIIATHNSNFLTGILLSRAPVDILRLNRAGDVTKFQRIPAQVTKKLTTSPLLSSQRVLESIFHKGVIVCEGDTDRSIYETVAIREFKNKDILFMHAHDKYVIKDVVDLLQKAEIPVCVIVDIDILNSKFDFKELLQSLDPKNDFSSLIETRNEIALKIEKISDAKVLTQIKKQVKELSQELKQGEHILSGARSALGRIRQKSSKWETIKLEGIDGLDNSDQDEAKELVKICKKHGLFIVHVGVLENWIKLPVKKKKKWIIQALEKLNSKKSPKKLSQFVNETLAFFVQ